MVNNGSTYNKQGLYNGYKKNNKERQALDYYATPIEETENILEILGLDFNGLKILEPAAGAGHMVKGIENYIDKHGYNAAITATDIMVREPKMCDTAIAASLDTYDFLQDNYPIKNTDVIIMNPPYNTIDYFVAKALPMVNKYLLLLGRMQFLEGSKRYELVLKDNPPTDVFIYVDRISCWKNGEKPTTSSA